MDLKKISLLVSIPLISISSLATNYNVIISAEHSKYDHSEEAKWIDDGSVYDCSVFPLSSNYYEMVEFEETTSCSQDQTKTIHIYDYDNDGNKYLKETIVDEKTIIVNSVIDVMGTYTAKSCLDIKNHNGDIGDGDYLLTVGSDRFNTYCDMTNGGLTLVMHLKNSGQLNGTSRDSFWKDGADLTTSYSVSSFSDLNLNSLGFTGWDRINLMKDSNDLEMNIRGVNVLGDSVNEMYTLFNFSPNLTDNTSDESNMTEGFYSITKLGDNNIRNNWGTCGQLVNSTYSHIGLGLCEDGFNGLSPSGRIVQIWHYDNYANYLNVSFGNENSNTNISYNAIRNYDFYMFIK